MIQLDDRQLEIQMHLLTRYLNPQISLEARLLGVPKNLSVLFGWFWMSRELCGKQEDNECRSVFLLQLRFLFWNWVPLCSAWIFVVCWWANWAHAWMVDSPQAKVIKWLGVEIPRFWDCTCLVHSPFQRAILFAHTAVNRAAEKTPSDRNVSGPSILMGDGVWDSKKKAKIQALNVWYTYLHLLIFNGKCWNIYHIHYISVWEDNHWTTHTHHLEVEKT